MSNIDKQALREAAERATESDWIVDAHEGWHAVIPVADAVNGNYIIAEFQGPESKRNRDFVAAANPATVLALLDELEAKDKSISFLKDQLAQLANFNPDWDKLEAATYSLREHMAELTAARKRIAELEAREVLLPQRYSMLHRVDFDEPYHTEMVYKQHQVLEALHDAGVNVAAAGKGE
ncbi:ead/Ea22-like family protein [Enterobacter hormaechei]